MRPKMPCPQNHVAAPRAQQARSGAGLGLPTCDGLEEVGVVLQVVVAVVVVGPFAESTALLVRHEVLPQRRLQVGHGFLRLLLGVEAHSQPKLVLLGGRGAQMPALPSIPRRPPRASP